MSRSSNNIAQKKRGRPFQPGRSGNPAGRPRGSLNRRTLLLQQLFEGEAEAIGRKCIDLALIGDPTSLKLSLERLLPPVRDRLVTINVPPLKGIEDLPAFGVAVVNSIARGELTAAEGRALLEAADAFRRGVAESDTAKRLDEIEEILRNRSEAGL